MSTTQYPVQYGKTADGETFFSWRKIQPETPTQYASWARIRVDRGEITTENYWTAPFNDLWPCTEAEFAAAYKAALEKIYAERTLCIVQQTENAKQAERLTTPE
jgi:hypothetical protein